MKKIAPPKKSLFHCKSNKYNYIYGNFKLCRRQQDKFASSRAIRGWLFDSEENLGKLNRIGNPVGQAFTSG